MKINLSRLFSAAHQKLTSILDHSLRARENDAAPPPILDCQPVLAPPCRIIGDSPAKCRADYREAWKRGSGGGIAFTIHWSKRFPLAGFIVVRRHQAMVEKYMRDLLRRRGYPNAFIISAVECDDEGCFRGHFFAQANWEVQSALLDGVEAQLERRYGDRSRLPCVRGNDAVPFCRSNGRIPSAATGIRWVEFCLKGCRDIVGDVGIHHDTDSPRVHMVTVKWGFGRMPGGARLKGKLVAVSPIQDKVIH